MNVARVSSLRRTFLAFILILSSISLALAQSSGSGVLRELFENIGGNDVENLTGNPNFPDRPTAREVIPDFSFSSIGDNYGSRLRAYLSPSKTGSYRFWIAGDDNTSLFLSTSSSPENSTKIAEVPGWTGVDEWEKYDQQRSGWIELQADQSYYIEVLHKEGWGGDNVSVAWELAEGFARTNIAGSFLSPFDIGDVPDFYASAGTDFSVFTPANTVVLNGSIHEIVPSNSEPIISWAQISGNTVSLQESDTLNPTFSATTIGQYAFRLTVTIGDTTIEDEVSVTAEPALADGVGQFIQEIWVDLDARSIAEMQSEPDYPNRPHLVRTTTELRGPTNWGDKYGIRTRGYLTPPETGNYTFYVMGDDEVALFVDSDETGENSELRAYTAKATGENKWDRYPTQKSEPMLLEKGKRYYMELLFRDTWGKDYHAAAWSRDGADLQVISGAFFTPIQPDAQAPLVNENLHFAAEAGANQEIRTPDTLAFLRGRALKISDSFSIESTTWRQISGPPAVISYPNELLTNVTIPTEGEFVFQLSVRADGLVATDTVKITRSSPLSGSTGGFTREVWLDIKGSSVSDLENHPDYPTNPDIVDQISSLTGPLNWASMYGSRLSGYLVPSRTGPHTFYISADDSAKLLLSTDSSPANGREIATSRRVSMGHYRYDEQTSTPIDLVAGNRYYIEVRHKEYWGDDHVQVAWSFGDENSPQPIGGGNLEPRLSGIQPANALLTEYAHAGKDRAYYLPTSKINLMGEILEIEDDGPYTTSQWTYVGNEPGVSISHPSDLSTNAFVLGVGSYTFRLSINSRGQTHFDEVTITILPALSPDTGGLLRSVWLNVRGSPLSDLLEEDPNLSYPDFQDILPNLEAPSNWTDHYGQRMQGYLHVPTTGEYNFWIAADDMAELYLSTSRNPDQARRIANVMRAVSPHYWDRYDSQASGPITLQGGQSYYIEIRHKEGYRSDHLAVAWSGPDIEGPEIITAGYLSPISTARPHSEDILVLAGDDATIQWPANSVDLLGRVFDHHNGPERLSYQWIASDVSVSFDSDTAPATTARFSGPGAYQLTLIASDGENTSQDSLTVIVEDPLSPNAGGITREVWLEVHGYRVSHLLESDRYQESPDIIDTLASFETPRNWGDNYGQRLRGFIVPPSSGPYQFFAAGDDQVQVNLNTANESFDQMQQIILTDRAKSYRRWDKSESQRSAIFNLTAGQRYPIEVIHKEGGWSDHLSVAWKRPNSEEIEVISGAFLVPEQAAPALSDNVSVAAPGNITQRWPQNTVDLRGFALDMIPGPLPLATRWEQVSGPGAVSFTVSTALETNAHVSAPGNYEIRLYATDGSEEVFDSLTITLEDSLGAGSGAATREIFTDIKGNRVHNLLDSEKYPDSPDITAPMNKLDSAEEMGDNYGAIVSGQLLAPETGFYRFSVAGDDWVELWLSPDANPENRQLICFTPSYTDYYEWDKYPEYQTSREISLESGQRCYIEIRHKESGWRDHFAVAWLRPDSTEMEIVEGAYLAPDGTSGDPSIEPPQITLNGGAEMTVTAGSSFSDPGASAKDSSGADISSTLLTSNFVDTTRQGTYSVRYQVVNPGTGFAETAVRTVHVVAGQSALASYPAPSATIPPTETWSEPVPNAISANDASRFLAQATFGPTKAEIARVQQIGYSAWIEEQFSLEPSLHRPAMEAIAPLLEEMDTRQGSEERLATWWTHAINAQDQLRQRVAFALSQIFVVSDRNSFQREGQAMANYYDIMVRNAFGSYRDLLGEVTVNPMMGQYLTMLRSSAEQPDENYPREVLQLFSIGLNLLNPDGSLLLDSGGEPIPTYDQRVILELSRAFTGWTYSGSRDFFWVPWGSADLISPMMPMEAFHDTGAKELMGGFTLPAGLTPAEDLDRSLDHIADHPNVGPFMALRLIQRLVTSNPSPAYIYRVSQAFNNDGSGRRGNLGAVVKAILLDPEARDPDESQSMYFGKLREPVIRLTHLLRSFEADTSSNPPVFGRYPITNTNSAFHQSPLQAPSVFNFYSPFYAPPGPIQQANLTAPEFAINTEITTVDTTNFLHRTINRGVPLYWRYSADIRPRIEELIAQSNNANAVIDELNTLLMGGTMSSGTRATLLETLNALEQPEDIAATALKLVISSPEFSIQK